MDSACQQRSHPGSSPRSVLYRLDTDQTSSTELVSAFTVRGNSVSGRSWRTTGSDSCSSRSPSNHIRQFSQATAAGPDCCRPRLASAKGNRRRHGRSFTIHRRILRPDFPPVFKWFRTGHPHSMERMSSRPQTWRNPVSRFYEFRPLHFRRRTQRKRQHGIEVCPALFGP
ncbi:UNVERIFIED_CONTAM: hypothetical protein GTU68_022875 [Idotea baltica]|nr:hypothetical protein [Idotea baltica]